MFEEVSIKSVKPLYKDKVYDLSVNQCHQFVANGILHSNSQEPNMQQIPKTSVDPNIKKQLIARPGKLYLTMDFSQAELRIMAHLSGDETYLEAFAKGQDPHLAIAAKKYGIDYSVAKAIMDDDNHPDCKIWKTRRKQAKQIVFGLIYGIQAKLLSIKLSDPKSGLIVTPEEAQQMQDEFFEEHPKIRKYMKLQEKRLIKQGYIQSLFGNKRRLPQIYSDNSAEAAYAVRLSVNFPCVLPSTQALCKTKGWVNYENLTIGDEILAFNPINGKSEWQSVLELHTPEYEGYMYNFNSKHCGVSSTDYHRWYISKTDHYEEAIERRLKQEESLIEFNNLKQVIQEKYNEGYNFSEIGRMLNISSKRCSRILSGEIKKPFSEALVEPFEVLTSKEIDQKGYTVKIPISAKHLEESPHNYPDWFIGLCGWYLTDASIRHNKVRIMQSNKANPHKVSHIDGLFRNSSLEYTRRVTKNGEIVVWDLSRDSSGKFLDLLPNRELNMDFISTLSVKHLNILLENMRLGDGYKLFCSKSEEQASLIQAIVVLIGKFSSMFICSKPGDISYFRDRKPSKCGQKYIKAKNFSYDIKFSDRKTVHTYSYNKKLIEKEFYKGKVWCPTVKSGAFFIRYQSRVDGRYRTMITGNCQNAASHMTLFGSVLNYWDMYRGFFPKMDEVCTVHDAVYYNTYPEYINVYTIWKMWDTFRNPKTKKYFGFQIDDVDMSMDFEIGRSMAEELPFIPGYDYKKMLQPDFSVEEYMEEHKKFKDIEIKDYPKVFPEEFNRTEQWKKLR